MAINALRLKPPWLVWTTLAVGLISVERAGHSRKRFAVQVYLAPSRVSSFGARMATVSDLPKLRKSRASSVSFLPICV